MTEQKTLAQMSENISGKLLDSIYLLDILSEIFDGNAHEGTLINITKQNINDAFCEIEKCREVISLPD